jgi:hypothetical protein
MTLTLDLATDVEERLKRRATLAGIPLQELVANIIEDAAQSDVAPGATLLDEMRSLGVLGAVSGTPGPGDGRAWSEIEAACDPL